ncbi:MAG: ABC transporter permease [Chloroflexi bacterium]|nr:ABC transporter permease [Chloroflexota bacterium]
MANFVIRRVISMVPTLIGATLLVFLIMRVVPGDIAFQILAGSGEGGNAVDPVALARLRHQLGTDRPLYVQYVTWIAGVARGDLGDSLKSRRSILSEVAPRIPVTFQLGVMSLFFGVLFGLPLGILSALKRGTKLDVGARVFSVFFLAIPTFWLGLLVIVAGQRLFNWIPPLGRNYLWVDPGANLAQLIFPSLIVASHLMAIISRMTRSTMLEVLREDYIRTARAKGLAESTVIVRHVMRNSMIPVITIVSLSLGQLVAGSTVMEQVFTIPGMGLYTLQSITAQDYTAVQAMVLIFATFFIVLNFLVDLTYGWFDPRITHS